MLNSGEEVNGYIVEDFIAPGASGHVYRAHKKSDPQVLAALKLLSNTQVSGEEERFRQENDILHDLHPHDSIAKPYTRVGNHTAGLYYAMEFFPISFIQLDTPPHDLDFKEKVAIVIRIAEGLKHAHAQEVTHRDLHPGNILFIGRHEQGYGARITDFGRAIYQRKLLSLTDDKKRGWGHPYYFPPEVY